MNEKHHENSRSLLHPKKSIFLSLGSAIGGNFIRFGNLMTVERHRTLKFVKV